MTDPKFARRLLNNSRDIAKVMHSSRIRWCRDVFGIGGISVLSVTILVCRPGTTDASLEPIRSPTHLLAVDDTYVVDWGTRGGDHHVRDKETVLKAVKSDIGPRYVTFVKFPMTDVMKLDQDVQRAVLRLRRGYGGPDPLDGVAAYGVHVVTAQWIGSQLDGSIVPTFGPAIDRAFPQAAALGDWIEWDVTRALRETQSTVAENGFAIAVDDARVSHSYSEFSSNEGGSPPELVIGASLELYLPRLDVPLQR
jgi:hypothetical protein